ncbi:MAG: sulfurtransferase TusA family protein [Thiomicrorhabdus chilensis]|uniref:sulfurtransferase TusA family protein n=1 Tax=Thiomicrorhabdus chilensis TaxID=63656 RepID=UPI00299E6DA4|nr:sulfurtransferase TusA family protein [Thiomicrorhabdus chilensis]MDX1346726.1 sulfurtransferase TusA family protein [Thiomicrorhabdus chilensis]
MQRLDLTGLACPMPIIKLKKFLSQNPALQDPFIVEVSDSGALKDIPAFCQQQKLNCQLRQSQPNIEFQVQRGADV